LPVDKTLFVVVVDVVDDDDDDMGSDEQNHFRWNTNAYEAVNLWLRTVTDNVSNCIKTN
jgi:hypothetical protein